MIGRHDRARAASANDVDDRLVPTESMLSLWKYLHRASVVRSVQTIAWDLKRAKRTVLRDFHALEQHGVVARGSAGEWLVRRPPDLTRRHDGNQEGTAREPRRLVRLPKIEA